MTRLKERCKKFVNIACPPYDGEGKTAACNPLFQPICTLFESKLVNNWSKWVMRVVGGFLKLLLSPYDLNEYATADCGAAGTGAAGNTG
jgi:hypothetical protein